MPQDDLEGVVGASCVEGGCRVLVFSPKPPEEPMPEYVEMRMLVPAGAYDEMERLAQAHGRKDVVGFLRFGIGLAYDGDLALRSDMYAARARRLAARFDATMAYLRTVIVPPLF